LSQWLATLLEDRAAASAPVRTTWWSTIPVRRTAMFRQGDVLLVPVSTRELPTSVQPLPRDARGRLVLALGEATGHAHAVSARDAELLADPAEVDRRFLRIATEAMLTHEEHAPIPLPAGLYRVVQQREFVPGSFEAGWFRPVAD
jgi:hypothetical protein